MSNETQKSSIDWLEEKLTLSLGDELKPLRGFFVIAKEMQKKETISFASWIAKSEWMSIWVEDKWMWECQRENSNTTYKTDKELFEIFYNETYGGNK